MDQRIVEFIAALRSRGIRVSVAESEDAFRAALQIGIRDRQAFQDALRATLVKEGRDRPTFDELFGHYFGSGGPPMNDLSNGMAGDDRDALERALRSLFEHLRQAAQRAGEQQGNPEEAQASLAALMQLLEWLLRGNGPSAEEIERMADAAGLDGDMNEWQLSQVQRDILDKMGIHALDDLLNALEELLRQAGMSPESIRELMEGIEANRQAMEDRIAQHVGASAAERHTESHPHQRQDVTDLMRRPFESLTEREADLLRTQVRRLAAQLRSRAALRRKRGKRGALDVKRLVRANLRYGGVPLELRFKVRHLKPKLLLVCDISTSMRPVVDFLLRLIYELQDQVATARSFAYIDDLNDITPDFGAHRPEVAIELVLTRLPPGHYNTDLGNSLNTLMERHPGTVDPRTTVIFVGDGRNNFNNPRLDLMDRIQRRARRVIWLNPEHPRQWGTGDSDMPAYLPYADAVLRVSTLAELTDAVDQLLTGK
ncbi:MAG TPA: VWA domain-containing protein [Anaerolineae bacterium]|nr:VWA domain-containing protein [Anaerolineae bacterium]